MADARDRELERARKVARILDRYGVDPILGLILPEIGDVIGALFGLYLVVFAIRRRLSPVVIARMLLNLGLDALLGAIPLIGDVGDFFFKANERNLALIEARHERRAATARDWAMLAFALVFVLGVIAAVVWSVVSFLRWLNG